VNSARDYIATIKGLIILHPQIVQWIVVREEYQGNRGLFRYRLILKDGSFLEMFELFQMTELGVKISKYSFHWQSPNGELYKRWDNAAHHKNISTYPYHIHEGAEDNILPHSPVTAEEILTIIS
jgi:Family of unknown function (DUF6516)